MPNFLDRLGDQLHDAPRGGTLATGASRQRTTRRSRHLSRRTGLTLAAILAVAAPAAAIMNPWAPALQREGIDKPVQTDTTAVSQTAVDALAPLRRKQTADDRRIATPLIKAIGIGNQVDRVQTEAIRAVAPGWALVPANVVRSGPNAVSPDQLCLTNGETVGCSPADNFTKNGLGIYSATKTQTSIVGLVPDAVARVRFAPATGNPVEVTVNDNFFSLSVPETRPSVPVKAPPGYDGPETIPGPPIPVDGILQWFDDNGQVVGPADPQLK